MATSTLTEKVSVLAQMIKKSGLLGKKADQEIEHTEVTAQDNLGAEMQQVVNEQPGNQASNPADMPPPVNDKVRQEPGVQDLNKPAEEALAATGTEVNNIAVDGSASGTPAQEAKTASDYQHRLASILHQINLKKNASAQRETQPAAPAAAPEVISAHDIMAKFASIKTQKDQEEAQALFAKFASTNPVFETARASAMRERMLSDINDLALAKGISHKQAAEELDAALAADPEAAAELADDVDGAAVADLAQGEEATAGLLGDIQGMADGASQVIGQEVTPDMLIEAADKVAEMAAEMGVPPEALLAQAIQEMTGAAPKIEGNTPEELEAAQQIMAEAAQQGISPDEVIQMATQELAGGKAAPAEQAAAQPAAEPEAQAEDKNEQPAEQPKDEEGAEKAAALQKLSSSRLGRIALGI